MTKRHKGHVLTSYFLKFQKENLLCFLSVDVCHAAEAGCKARMRVGVIMGFMGS